MVEIVRRVGVKNQVVTEEKWMNAHDTVKELGLPSVRSLERLRKRYPDFVKKVHSVFMYNISGILEG